MAVMSRKKRAVAQGWKATDEQRNKKSQPEQSSGVFLGPPNGMTTAPEVRGIRPICRNKENLSSEIEEKNISEEEHRERIKKLRELGLLK